MPYTVTIYGAQKSGKTELVNRAIHNSFQGWHEPTSVGMSAKYPNDSLEIWDTPGFNQTTPEFLSMYSSFANVIIFAVDLTDTNALQGIENWLKTNTFLSTYNKEAIQILVGTKSDLTDELIITKEALIQFAAKHNLIFDPVINITSAKTDINVKAFFDFVVNKAEEKFTKLEEDIIQITSDDQEQETPGCCSVFLDFFKPSSSPVAKEEKTALLQATENPHYLTLN